MGSVHPNIRVGERVPKMGHVAGPGTQKHFNRMRDRHMSQGRLKIAYIEDFGKDMTKVENFQLYVPKHEGIGMVETEFLPAYLNNT